MRYQLLKAWNDVRTGGARSALVIFALALGLWGLGSVAVSSSILGPDLRQNFLGTAPPHAVVTPAQPHGLDTTSLGPGVEAAEYRDLALLRVEVAPDEWIPLWLFAVEDFDHTTLAHLWPQSGAKTPPPGTMVIERNGLLISNLRTGSLAPVRAENRRLEIPVSGVVFDPAQAPATQDHFIYAYTDPATWSSITGQPSGQRLIVRFHDAHGKTDVERAVAALHLPPDALAQIPAFEEHPHQWQLDLLLAIIGSVGLLSFVLSSVMVSQVTSALLAKQTRQIGVLKAIGASRARVTGLYALYLAAFAVPSGLIAIPLAIATGSGFAAFCAAILNFDILTKSVPAGTLALLIGSALVLPFLFAGPLLARAGGIPIRQALADAAVSPPASGPTRGSWALRNLLRRPGRTLVTVAATALGVAIFATGFNMRESLAQFLATTRDAMKFDVQVVLSRPMDGSAFAARFGQLPGVARTELWLGGRGELQTRVAGTDTGLGVVALPIDTVMAAPRLPQGRWLKAAPVPEVVLNQAALKLFGEPTPPADLTLKVAGQDRRVTLVGVAEEIDKPKVYLDADVWDSWTGRTHQANTLSLKAVDNSFAGVQALKKQIESVVARSDLSVLYVISQAERTKIIADHLDIILAVLLILAFLVLWVSALGMATATSITVLERTREIGVLRAIGAGPRRIVGLFVGEGLTASAAGLVLGLALSWPLSQVASGFFGTLMLGEGAVLRYAWSPVGWAITVVVTALFGWLASRLPAQAALRLSTRQALTYE